MCEDETTSVRSRRKFLGELAAGAASASGLALTSYAFASTKELYAEAPKSVSADAEKWLVGLKGKHRQLVDAYEPNSGFPLAFAHTFLVAQPANTSAGAVVVLRHFAMPIALGHSMWSKYKIGEALNITDPATGKPAVRNPFYQPPGGVLLVDDMAVDRLLQRKVIIGACGVALAVLSGKFAGNAEMSADAARAEWTANIIPGIPVLPSGTWGVNRAQEAGCTYCTGGG
jgi:hypothetical protein